MSTMTAIMGRMATYSGKIVRFKDAIRSDIQLANVDALHSLDDIAPVLRDAAGDYPLPIPGSKTPLT